MRRYPGYCMDEEIEAARVFLLSPANVAGKRAKMLLNPEARFDLAQRLNAGGGVPLGEAFAFMSGLYFRGKLAYAHAFARAPKGVRVYLSLRVVAASFPPIRW